MFRTILVPKKFAVIVDIKVTSQGNLCLKILFLGKVWLELHGSNKQGFYYGLKVLYRMRGIKDSTI